MWHERDKRKSAGRIVLKGGYGGESGKKQREKDGCYYDSGNDKVTDKNAMIAAEYYLDLGMYVVFLHEYYSRPDLLVDFNFLAEVKGIGSDKSGTISKQIKHASRQIDNELENLPADNLEIEHDDIFFYAWRCARCGTFTFFNDLWKCIGTYAPKEEFSQEPMQEPFEFGPFWNDFQWFEITESDDNRTSEVLTKFPGNRWLAKNARQLGRHRILLSRHLL